MKQPILSIIVPVYNVEPYLRQCLDSLVTDFPEGEAEIIIVDDGSSDGSSAICGEYADRYKEIRLHRQPNTGLSEARNAGIRMARGNYVAFLDSDDFMRHGAVRRLVAIARDSQTDIIFTRAYNYDSVTRCCVLGQTDYSGISTWHPASAMGELLGDATFWFAAWLVVVNREFLMMNGLLFQSGLYHEDELWVPQVFILARTARFVNEGFICYRLHREGSIVNSLDIRKAFDVIKIADCLGEFSGISAPGDDVIRYRRAALLHSLVLGSECHCRSPRYPELKAGIMERIDWLCFGKYRVERAMLRLLGLDRTRRLLNLRHRRGR